MKHLKLFDAYNSNELKLELSEDDCFDILDFFQAQIADKYRMKFFQQEEILEMPDPEDGSAISNYSGQYNKYSKKFEIIVSLSDDVNAREFITDGKKLKDRLTSFGFESSGHYDIWSASLYTAINRREQRKYFFSIYKPMFPRKKNLKKVSI